MKKNIKLFIVALAALTCSAFALVACGDTPTPTGTLEVPAELAIIGTDLTWETVTGAASYEVSVDGATYSACEDTSVDIFTLPLTTSTTKLYVRAVAANGTKSDVVELSVTVQKAAAPAKGTVITDPDTNSKKIVWTAVEHVQKYLVKVNDGKWITYSKTEYIPTSTGSYAITVKSKGYISGTTIYLDSDESEVSEALVFLQGSALSNPEIHILSWDEDDFDAFKLIVDGGEEIDIPQAGLEVSNGIYNLNFVESGIVTKTGEYDFQLACYKGDDVGYSNTLTQVGTANINPNEYYSFDNRVARNNQITENAYLVTDFKHLGNGLAGDASHPGASFKIDGSAQCNFIAYFGSTQNPAVDLRLVDQLEYWVYVEKPSTAEEEDIYVPMYALPSLTYDFPRVNIFPQESYNGPDTGLSSVKFNEWTKCTVNCANEHSNVLVISNPGGLTVFIDDIYITKKTTLPSDVSAAGFTAAMTETNEPKDLYVLRYFDGGNWWNDEMSRVVLGSEYANKTVELIFDAKLQYAATAPAGISGTEFDMRIFSWYKARYDAALNYQNVYTEQYKGTGAYYLAFKNTDLSTTDYTRMSFRATADDDGNIYVSTGKWGSLAVGGFRMFIKPSDIIVIDGTSVPFQAANANDANTGYYAVALLDASGFDVGDVVDVSLKLYATTNSDWSNMGTASKFWSNDTPNGTAIWDNATYKANSGTWQDVTFTGIVIDKTELAFASAGKFLNVTASGKYVLLYANSGKEDVFSYKGLQIEFLATNVPMQAANTGDANTGYFAVALLDASEFDVGETVNVSVDVYTTTVSEWATLSHASTFNTDNTPVASNVIWDRVTYPTNSGKWTTVTFSGVVIDNTELAFISNKKLLNITVDEGTKYILLYANSGVNDVFWYTNLTITAETE